jgi:hypothetical protein
VTSERAHSILWCIVRDGKATEGYLFHGPASAGMDGPADVSLLQVTPNGISGTVRGSVPIAIRGGISFERAGGVFGPKADDVSGTFHGTVLPLDRSRLARVPEPRPRWRPPAETNKPAATAAPKAPPGAAAFLAKIGADQRPAVKLVWPKVHGEYPDGLKRVTLPPQHRRGDSESRYPVIFHNGVGGYPGALFTLMKQGKLRPVICCNVGLGGDGNDGKLDVIIDYLHRNWPASRRPEHKVLMGFSAGAHHAFRYLDRADLVGNFAFFGHPLKGAGWTHQRAREYEAVLRGRRNHKPFRPRILLVVGTREGSWKAMQLTRDWLKREFSLEATYIEVPDTAHRHDQHFAKRGAEIAEWVEAAFGR